MAHFIAGIHGNRGSASRLGTKSSGISAYIQGWDSGVLVTGWHLPATDQDVFEIYATHGSNNAGADRFVGTVTQGADGSIIFAPAKLDRELHKGDHS